jgi:hypothetical protein
MNDALTSLQFGLAKSFAGVDYGSASWTDSAAMARVVAQIQREHGGAGIAADPRSITSALAAFRRNGTVEGGRDLKYVCLGVGLIDQGWCVLADPRLRHKVAALVEDQTEWRRRIRCLQALLSSYWTFPLYSPSVSEAAREGWCELRDWLRAERVKIARSTKPKPLWFSGLSRHSELLSSQPCDKFGKALLAGDFSELNEAMEMLAIPNESWVLSDAILAQMKATAGLSDEDFKKILPKLVPIAMGTGGVEIGEPLRIRCVAQLVSRYAKCKDRAEHMALRDAAVSTIGNPWLRRTNWDAWVVDGRGKPDDQAREMVNGWLKRRLIADFFVLLSVDGTGDPRRLDYWLRFEPFIEDMWFALGRDAQTRRGEHFDEFRANAKGRLLTLEDTTADNNAFVMKIGKYLAIEFGATGNAFRLFKWDSIGETLTDTLTSGRIRARVSHTYLKALDYEEKLNHIDSGSRTWEQKFDDQICPLFGRRPTDRPRGIGVAGSRVPRGTHSPLSTHFVPGGGTARFEVELRLFAQTHHLVISDVRKSGGALWVVCAGDLPGKVSAQLKAWGFRPRPGRGWYKE